MLKPISELVQSTLCLPFNCDCLFHPQMEIASEIAGGTVRAFSTIYMSLENSSKILARNMANNTVTIVTHKYDRFPMFNHLFLWLL